MGTPLPTAMQSGPGCQKVHLSGRYFEVQHNSFFIRGKPIISGKRKKIILGLILFSIGADGYHCPPRDWRIALSKIIHEKDTLGNR